MDNNEFYAILESADTEEEKVEKIKDKILSNKKIIELADVNDQLNQQIKKLKNAKTLRNVMLLVVTIISYILMETTEDKDKSGIFGLCTIVASTTLAMTAFTSENRDYIKQVELLEKNIDKRIKKEKDPEYKKELEKCKKVLGDVVKEREQGKLFKTKKVYTSDEEVIALNKAINSIYSKINSSFSSSLRREFPVAKFTVNKATFKRTKKKEIVESYISSICYNK